MATIADVARAVLDRIGKMSPWRLHKLLYYCQAWSLVWDEAPLFDDAVHAWAGGPTFPSLYERHKGKWIIDADDFPDGNPTALSGDERETVNVVLGFYGDREPWWLADLVRMEDPWKHARAGLEWNARSDRPISWAAIAEYYGNLASE